MNPMPGRPRGVIVLGAAPEALCAVRELAALGYAVAWLPLEEAQAPAALPPNVAIYPAAELVGLGGYAGAFCAQVRRGEAIECLPGAAVLIALGNARCYPQERYGLPLGPRVLTPPQARQRLKDRTLEALLSHRKAHFLVMLDWGGETSRETAVEALHTARALRQNHAEVTLFYRDLKVDSAPLERLTRRMREEGVVFCRYIEVEVRFEEGGVHIAAPDGLVRGDMLILPEAVQPHPATLPLAALLKLRVGKDGYFQEVNVRQVRPGLTNRKGIYVAGRCHMDADREAALEDVSHVVASLDAFLHSLDEPPSGPTAEVERDRCIRCLTCVRTCPHAAAEVVEREGITAAYVEKAACWGCGICAAHCPVQAIALKGQAVPSWLAPTAQGVSIR